MGGFSPGPFPPDNGTLWHKLKQLSLLVKLYETDTPPSTKRSVWGQSAWGPPHILVYIGPDTRRLKGFHTRLAICTSELCEIARNIILVPFTDKETEAQKASSHAPNWLVVGTKLNSKHSILKNLIVSSYRGFPDNWQLMGLSNRWSGKHRLRLITV